MMTGASRFQLPASSRAAKPSGAGSIPPHAAHRNGLGTQRVLPDAGFEHTPPRRREPDLRVVFMTGYSRNAIVDHGRLDPGVALIKKPLTSEQLAAAVRKALDG
jgi:hypothetical protein